MHLRYTIAPTSTVCGSKVLLVGQGCANVSLESHRDLWNLDWRTVAWTETQAGLCVELPIGPNMRHDFVVSQEETMELKAEVS